MRSVPSRRDSDWREHGRSWPDPKEGRVPSLDTTWRKSTRSSTNGSCVEVRRMDAAVEVRDTKDRGGPVLTFTPDSWQTFVAAVHGGEFDRP